MKIIKGAEALVKNTLQIVTITDIELIRKKGSVHKYCQVKPADGPSLWMDSSELMDTVERATMSIRSDSGQTLQVNFAMDYKNGTMKMDVTGEKPVNLKEHRGLHVMLAEMVIKSMKRRSESFREVR